MKYYEDYYLGLDIGTNSVGWAVTDPQYNICKFNQKSMWGIRLFESANTAADRRMKRANRRRLQRRVQRINLLQDLFKEEICKVDPHFLSGSMKADYILRTRVKRLHIVIRCLLCRSTRILSTMNSIQRFSISEKS